MRLRDVILRNTRANQPAAADVPVGTLFYVTDEVLLERSTGAAWESVSTGAPASADYLVATANGSLSAERVITAGNATAWDTTVAGQAKVQVKRTIGITIDGGGATITTGVKGFIRVPWTGTITKNTLLADQSGAIVIDVWKDVFANFPPTDADSITASAPPTISGPTTHSEDATLSGWTTSVTAGDVLGFNVDSVTDIQRVTLQLEVTF